MPQRIKVAGSRRVPCLYWRFGYSAPALSLFSSCLIVDWPLDAQLLEAGQHQQHPRADRRHRHCRDRPAPRHPDTRHRSLGRRQSRLVDCRRRARLQDGRIPRRSWPSRCLLTGTVGRNHQWPRLCLWTSAAPLHHHARYAQHLQGPRAGIGHRSHDHARHARVDHHALGGSETLGVPNSFFVVIGVRPVLRCSCPKRWSGAAGSMPSEASPKQRCEMGIPVKGVLISTYVISGLCAGIGAVVLAGRTGASSPLYGNLLELDTIAAVIIGGASFLGGRGHVGHALVGAVMIGVIRNALNLLNVDVFFQMIAIGLIIVVAVEADVLRNHLEARAASAAGGEDAMTTSIARSSPFAMPQKRFGAVHALKDVSLDAYRGEVLALLGDNGAGKSTLVKCISGVHALDEGEILLDGEATTHPLACGCAPRRHRDRLPGSRAVRQSDAGTELLLRSRDRRPRPGCRAACGSSSSAPWIARRPRFSIASRSSCRNSMRRSRSCPGAAAGHRCGTGNGVRAQDRHP